jgi:hypothetical protein
VPLRALSGWLALLPPRAENLLLSCGFSNLCSPLTLTTFSSQCAGTTPQGQDFETFIGSEKAKEFRALFSLWIHKLYRACWFPVLCLVCLTLSTAPSEWHLYSLGKQASDDLSTGSGTEHDGGEDVGADADVQHEDQAMVVSNATDTASVQPVVTPLAAAVKNDLPSSHSPSLNDLAVTPPVVVAETGTSNDIPSSDMPPGNPCPALPTEHSAGVVTADQDIHNPVASSRPDHRAPSCANDILFAGIDDLPASAVVAEWMKAKNTLKYFREVHKTGKLSALILHWYWLEKALGFPETVSSFITCAMRNSADLEQTPKGFPTQNRPQILSVFFKNGHNYKKNYKLEAKSLGGEIMCWWEEIKISNVTVNVRYGGPTGVYTLVVLVSWWCLLLKGQPDNELVDCLRTIEDIDRVISSAIHNTSNQPPIAPSRAGSPSSTLTPAAPQPRGSKRVIPEEVSSRKRLRSARA